MIEPRPASGASSAPPSQRIVSLAARLEATGRQADVMERGYQVRSKLPVFGPLIAWIRRNLTSHLREPYLDPALERQVALNRELIAILGDLLQLQADQEARLEQLHKEQDHE
jgi:hypothetical protein